MKTNESKMLCHVVTCQHKARGHTDMYRVSQKKLGSQNFQIAITHSFLKLKSIVIPLNQMSRSGEKICIGLKFNLVHFNGPQTKFKIFEIPVFFTHPVDI